MKRALLWTERLLVVVGIVAGVWCARILVEAQRTKNLPIEPVRVTMTLPALPGDEGRERPAPSRTSAVKTGTVIGKLEAARLSLSTPVLEGTDDPTLDRGAGHIEDTPFPTGAPSSLWLGNPSNVGIAGHRDTVFRPLRHAKVGDVLKLTTADHVYEYTISKTLIVDPEDVYVLDPTKEPTLTLVTCYPFDYIGHAPRRFIVQARLATQ
jgi:sortase A